MFLSPISVRPIPRSLGSWLRKIGKNKRLPYNSVRRFKEYWTKLEFSIEGSLVEESPSDPRGLSEIGVAP